MSIRRIMLLGLPVLLVAVTGANSSTRAQQTTGTPGSPGATTTIDGRYLPAPPPKFGGEVGPKGRSVARVAKLLCDTQGA